MTTTKTFAVLAAALSTASAATYQGFNYGASSNFNTEFALAKQLAGTNGAFTSARLYTMIEPNTANTPTSAIPAAISNDVTLLLGIWASAGQTTITNEIAALKSAITTYGTNFTSLVAGIGVGSEDLYRISPTGVENMSGVGAEPADIVNYISQVRAAISGTALESALVGHIDTWTSWVNGSNSDVVSACDFIGLDAYPYFQTTDANDISQGYSLFFDAFDATVAAVGSKPVFVTETGWPVSASKVQNQAVASVANAQSYWDAVGCKLFGQTNTWWYILDDQGADPSFGVSTGSSTPLFDLTCTASSSSSSASASATSSSTGAVVGTLAPVKSTSQSSVSVGTTANPSSVSGSGSPALASAAHSDSSASSLATTSASSSARSSASSAASAASTTSTTTVSSTKSSSTSGSSSTTATSTSSTASASSTSSASASAATGAAVVLQLPVQMGLSLGVGIAAVFAVL